MTDPYLSDAPIHSDGDDRLDRADFAGRVAETILSRVDVTGIVVGLYGAWGEGKSSVLELVQRRVAEDPRYVAMPFNPWYVRTEAELVGTFLRELGAALGHKVPRLRKKLADALTRYSDALGVLPAGRVAAGVAKALSEESLESLRDTIKKILANGGLRVVVLMDDVDRLDADEMLAVVKLVKLTGDFDRLTFVLAFDDVVVSNAIAQRFPPAMASQGHGYLEKIVQVPLRLPPADPAKVRALALDYIHHAAQEHVTILPGDWQEFRRYFEPLFGAAPRTLRVAKRLANAVAFGLPLVRDRVHLRDYLLVEALRVLYPAVYSALPTRRDGLLGIPPDDDAALRAGGVLDEAGRVSLEVLTHGLPSADRAAVSGVLRALFPRAPWVRSASALPMEESGPSAASERRIAAPAFFDEYFRYAPEARQGGATLRQELWSAITLGKMADSRRLLHALLLDDPSFAVLEELAEGDCWATEEAARCATYAVAAVGHLVVPDLIRAAAGPHCWAALAFPAAWPWPPGGLRTLPLLSALLRRQRRSWADDWTVNFALTGEPLLYPLAWFAYQDIVEPDGRVIISSEARDRARDALAQRCQQWVTQHPAIPPSEALQWRIILGQWVRLAGGQETSRYIVSISATQRDFAVELLHALAIAREVDPVQNDQLTPHLSAIWGEATTIIPPTELRNQVSQFLRSSPEGSTAEQKRQHAAQRAIGEAIVREFGAQ